MTIPESEVDRVKRWKLEHPAEAAEIQRRADQKYYRRERLLRDLLLHPPTDETETDTE